MSCIHSASLQYFALQSQCIAFWRRILSYRLLLNVCGACLQARALP
jgi:hypothetical protein